MNAYIRISVPLTKDDFVTLRDAAAKELRDPRQHAAWLLRQVLSSGDAQPALIDEQKQSSIGQDLPVASAAL